jgi:hypothetical protein
MEPGFRRDDDSTRLIKQPNPGTTSRQKELEP